MGPPPRNQGETVPTVSGRELGELAAPGRSPLVITVSPATNADGQRAYSKRGPLFDCKVEGRLIVERSHQPFLEGARWLVELGYDPEALLVMRHAGSDLDSLRATIGAAARLTIKERNGAPRFERWMPFSLSPVEPGMRESGWPVLDQPPKSERASDATPAESRPAAVTDDTPSRNQVSKPGAASAPIQPSRRGPRAGTARRVAHEMAAAKSNGSPPPSPGRG